MDKFFQIIKLEEPKKKEIEDDDIELICKKYEPDNFNNLVINNRIGLKITNIIKSRDIINLFIYGPSGSGKSLLSKLYIKEYLGFNYNLNYSTYVYESKEITYLKNNYVYEININLQNFNDINLISKFLEAITNKETNGFSNKKKVIIFKNINLVKKVIYIMLKNIVDKYSNFNVFIFISNKFIPNIFKGLFCLIRVPSPSNSELIDLGNLINKKAKHSELEYIIKISDNSITKFKNIMELSYINGSYEKYEDSDNDKLRFLYKILYKKKIVTLIIIRDLINELFIDNINEPLILNYLLNSFYRDYSKKKIEKEKVDKIHRILIDTDFNIKNGFRPIHHFEYAFIKIMNIL